MKGGNLDKSNCILYQQKKSSNIAILHREKNNGLKKLVRSL